MPVDTSSYYPEVPDPEGRDEGYSLNSRNQSLFHDHVEVILKEDDKEPCPVEPAPSSNESHEDGVEKFITIFSNLLSWILVPLLMPVFGLILAFGLSILDIVPMGMRVRFTFIIFGINFIIPVLTVGLLKVLGVVKDLGLNGRKERLLPYIVTAICMGCSAWFLAQRGAPVWLSMFYAGGALASLINLMVNFKWKISAHAAAIAGVIALLIRIEHFTVARPQLLMWLLITIGVTGLLGSARIWLGRHTVWQVLAGYAVGFCSVFFLTMIH